MDQHDWGSMRSYEWASCAVVPVVVPLGVGHVIPTAFASATAWCLISTKCQLAQIQCWATYTFKQSELEPRLEVVIGFPSASHPACQASALGHVSQVQQNMCMDALHPQHHQ